MSARPRLAAGAGAAAALMALAGCGSTPADRGTRGVPGGISALSLATSAASPAGTSWAVVQMGGPSAQQENFWQLFVRPAGAARWKLATPAGVASNGGLVVSSAGGTGTGGSGTGGSGTGGASSAGTSVAGFRPSQDLTFSPLAASTDDGAGWSQGTLVSPGLADVPDALAAGPGGRLIALTDGGGAELGTRLGAAWTKLTTQKALALTAAGRSCSLASLTAAAWAPAGTPLLAGACRKNGTAGIFALRAGRWQAAGPALPPAMSGAAEVLALVTAGTATTAVIAVGRGPAADVIAAWTGDGATRWSLSPPLATGARAVRSVSILTGGSAGLVLAGGRGEAIAGPGAAWRSLPALPAGTATLAAGAAGQLDALAARRSTLTAWQLGAGSRRWRQLQVIGVSIPYGSSG